MTCLGLGLASKVRHRAWTRSVQGALATWSNNGSHELLEISMLSTDQVATAPCTDRVQARCLTFEATSVRAGNIQGAGVQPGRAEPAVS